MKQLVQEKAQAIALRKQGMSYSEILKRVPVAKSSLSLWLKDLPLTEDEKQVLKKRKDSNIARGRIKAASAHRTNRLNREQAEFVVAKQFFTKFQDETLFHTGIALYWAEGAKRQKMFHFMNSDEKMIEVMVRWLERYTEYTRDNIWYRLYLHEPFCHDNWEQWWMSKLSVSAKQFKKTVVKPSGLHIKKRPNYRGCLRIEVPRSSILLLHMKFWISQQVEYHRQQ